MGSPKGAHCRGVRQLAWLQDCLPSHQLAWQSPDQPLSSQALLSLKAAGSNFLPFFRWVLDSQMLTPSSGFTHHFIPVSSSVSHYFARIILVVGLPALTYAAQTQHDLMLGAFACRFARQLNLDALEPLHTPVSLCHPSHASVAWLILATPPVPASSHFRCLGATFGQADMQLMAEARLPYPLNCMGETKMGHPHASNFPFLLRNHLGTHRQQSWLLSQEQAPVFL